MARGPQLVEHARAARLRAIATVTCLIVAAGSSWFSLIGAPASRFAPVVVLVAIPGLLAVSGSSRRATIGTAVLCVPGAMLAAGLPARTLAPRAWHQLVERLGSAAAHVIAGGGQPPTSAWALAAVMLASGALWMAGGMIAASGVTSTRRLIIAFVLLAAPWLTAVSESAPDRAAWGGALVLLAGVLWLTSTAVTIPLGVVTALLSVAIAQAVGPHSRWFGLGRQTADNLPFRSLDTQPTYGPLTDRRTGAPMLEVTAAQPALWRVQTLDYFDGGGWVTGPRSLPKLPQPVAHREQIKVRVLGLRQDLVVAPGRVQRVDARGSVGRVGGEAWQLPAMPRTGDTYDVLSSPVRVSADRLARDRAPLAPAARAYTVLGIAPQGENAIPLLGWVFQSLGLKATASKPVVDSRVVALARRVSAGARTEWDKVMRVERFLLDGGRFRYTTQLPFPGPQPVVDFLLRTHTGDCEHFAGAAALLLRLAGVPSRVVAGFATGRQTGSRQYVVRDLDAHDWIEVYFPGDGWVPFNPTPSASPATIAGALDPLRLGSRLAKGHRGLAGSGLLSALVAVSAVVVLGRRSRRRRRRAPEPLERIAGRTSGRLEPSTTLGQLSVGLSRIGPRTAALAAERERARFAAGPTAAPRHGRLRLVRALVSDVGALRALLLLAPGPRRILVWSGIATPTAEEGQDRQPRAGQGETVRTVRSARGDSAEP
jgi:hypothetical protein